jgi:phosphoribosylanthranilate isomerase
VTQVKICGIRESETLALLTELQADYVGFVFAPSKRRVDAQTARDVLAAVPGHPPAVGVFVNPSLEELESVLSRVPLAAIQLHGQEPPTFCRMVRERFSRPVWKALAVGEDDDPERRIGLYGECVDAFLFDTYDPAQAGGTGKRFSWEQIPRLKAACGNIPMVVAGGINSDNVEELISRYAPACIDVSSGVETDGKKDARKIRSFMERVRAHGGSKNNSARRTG